MQRNHIMIGVLLVIAAGNAWTALVQRELPTLHLTISAVALVLAVIVAVSQYDFPVRSEPARAPTPARRRRAVLMAVSGTLGSILWIAFAPWEARADFDVTGFLFLIQNMRQVVVLGIFAAIACTGLVLASPH